MRAYGFKDSKGEIKILSLKEGDIFGTGEYQDTQIEIGPNDTMRLLRNFEPAGPWKTIPTDSQTIIDLVLMKASYGH